MRVCCNWENMDLETLRNASLYLGGWEDYQITCMKNKAYHFEYERQVVSPKSDIKSIVYAKSVFWACMYACMSFIIIIQSLHDFAILRLQNLLQKLQFSQKFANFHNCRKIPTDFGLRRVPWHHHNVHSVKEKVVSQFEKIEWTASILIVPDFQELHQTNEPKAERIRTTRLGYRLFICLGWSHGLLSITRHCYTQPSNIVTSSRIRCRINNICQILWEAFKFSAEFC